MSPRVRRLIAGATIGVTLLGCVLWYAVRWRSDARGVPSRGARLQTAGLSCGPAALLAVAEVHDAERASRLGAILQGNGLATRPVSSLYDLATCARRAGFDPIGLKVAARQLHRLPLPAIVHVEPHHFLALMEVSDDRALLVERGALTCEISRRDFDRRFSGYVLCFKRFLERRG